MHAAHRERERAGERVFEMADAEVWQEDNFWNWNFGAIVADKINMTNDAIETSV